MGQRRKARRQKVKALQRAGHHHDTLPRSVKQELARLTRATEVAKDHVDVCQRKARAVEDARALAVLADAEVWLKAANKALRDFQVEHGVTATG